MSTSIGVREAKARLSHYLALASSGTEVVITHRGAAVARLVGVTPARARRSVADGLLALEREGLMERSERPLGKLVQRPVRPARAVDAAALVRSMRR